MLRIAIKPSRRLALLLCLAHAAAAGACLVSTMPQLAKALLLVVIALSCARSIYGPWRSRNAIVGLEASEDGALSFHTRAGEWRPCTLLGSSFVAPYLTILNLKCEGSRRTKHVVILADSVAADEFRHLRVWARWRAAPLIRKSDLTKSAID